MDDPFDLQRFVDAQQPVYAQVVDELRAGRKASHWMWFVFPQLAGLGQSTMARRYAISGRAEAEAYLRHSLLGARLRECAGLVNAVDTPIGRVFGTPDDLKFHSSMTLFARVSEGEPVFDAALRKFFAGVGDARTLAML